MNDHHPSSDLTFDPRNGLQLPDRREWALETGIGRSGERLRIRSEKRQGYYVIPKKEKKKDKDRGRRKKPPSKKKTPAKRPAKRK